MSNTQKQTGFINESALDRSIRLILGVIFLEVAFFWLGGAAQVVFYILSAILIVTAAVGFCPLYKILKIKFKEY